MKSKEYWAKRALQREDEAALRGTQLMEQVYDQYMKAAKEIQKNIDTFILKYGQKHGMTYNQAAAYLSKKEMQEWKKSLAEYVAEIKNASDNTQKGQLTARLDALSTNSSIRRLDALIGEIECILTGLCSDAEREARKELGELFQDSYYKKVYDIQSRAGYINQFAHLDQKTVEDILSYPWSGANFSKRIWKNRDNLAFNLRETLTSGFIQGKSRTQMAKEMSDEMGKGFSAVETLIRTESSWLHGAADQRAYEAASVERYEFMATLDNRTSQKCANLDGKDFPVSEAQVGVNYPPMHPRCRSTTIEHDPEEASDWFKSGKEMPKNMTYEEWAKETNVLKQATMALPKETSTKTVKKQELTEAQEYAVKSYISSGAYTLNEALRSDLELTNEQKEMIMNLDAALNQMPKYEGALHRFVDIADEDQLKIFLEDYKAGNIVTEKQYISATKGNEYNIDAAVQIRIVNSKKGHDLEKYNESEKEVLYKRGSKFKILDVTEREGIYYILAEEA